MKKVLSACLFLLPLISAAQYYSTGQDPASLHWRQIKTPAFRLIYPESFGNSSQYFANILNLLPDAETKTLHSKVPRIPVILHTQSAQSNGVTVWAPKRIELYPCPPQTLYPEEWLEQLSIHEYRHAVQISKLNRGFTKALYCIFGEQATGAVLGLFIPPWFMEGDAVCTETALTNSGRGRTYAFENILRAQLLEKKIYRYDKAVLGSYRTFIPDQYELGYPLVAETRKVYGPQVWNTPLDRSAKLPFMVVPFSSGIHHETGLTKTKLYRKMLEDLQTEWRKQDDSTRLTGYAPVTRRNPRNFSNYQNPILLNDTLVVSQKQSMDDPDRLVSVNRRTGREKNLLTLGPSSEESLSTGGNYAAWTEFRSHPRWQNKSYSVIRIYDAGARKAFNLTHRSRYFAPALSPDGSRVAAVFLDPENRCSIDILEVPGGRLLRRNTLARNQMALLPNWSPDGKELVMTVLTEKGKTLAAMDPESGRLTGYLPSGFTEIFGTSYFHDHHIFFSADYSGIENLYALDTLTGRVFQVTSARFSATDPDFTSSMDTLVYSDYTSDGMMIVQAPIDTAAWIPLEQVKNYNTGLADTLAAQEKLNLQDTILKKNLYRLYSDSLSVPGSDPAGSIAFPTRKYSKILNLFNPHSWAPASFDLNNLTLHPGVMVLMQNALSTTFASAGFDYNVNEETGKFFANLSYQGLYPVFDLSFSIGNRAGYTIIEPDHEQVRFTWQELNFSAAVSIPWDFSTGKYYRTLSPSFGTSLIQVNHLASTPENFTSGLIESLDYRLSFAQYFRQAVRDIYPRWGQALNFTFRNTPFSKNNLGSILETDLTLYFPGLFRHHSLWMYGGYQYLYEPSVSNYRFADLINYPRGYSDLRNQSVYSLMFNYMLPLFSPDWSVGSVLYFKRFKLNLFFDYAEGFNQDALNVYQSAGAELTTDVHLLRFLYPFELGLRTIYLPRTNSWEFQFLYAIRY